MELHERHRCFQGRIFLIGLGILPHVGSFVLSAGSPRWVMPASTESNAGLGGGIAFVVDSSFCSQMLPHFPERNFWFGGFRFVECADLRHAVHRGFATWSDNHHRIAFTDISTSVPCVPAVGESTGACPWELFVGTANGTEHETLAAFVENRRASNPSAADSSDSSRSPSGIDLPEMPETLETPELARSVMRFQTHICWFLDGTFCYYLVEDSGTVDLVVRICLLIAFALATLRLSIILGYCSVALWCLNVEAGSFDPAPASNASSEPDSGEMGQKGSGCRCRATSSDKYVACLNYLCSLSPCGNVAVLFSLLFPPIFHSSILLPCFECYDFESAVAHEAGHVLGFGHPDQEPQRNLAAVCTPTNATNCHSPMDACAIESIYDERGEASIMHSLTRKATRACLSAGDLAGLHLLYPSCDDLQPTSVACFKDRSFSGWLRLALVVGVPFLLAMVTILLPLAYLRRRDQKRIHRLGTEIAEYRAHLAEALQASVREGARAALRRPSIAVSAALHRRSTVMLPSGLPTDPADAAIGSGKSLRPTWKGLSRRGTFRISRFLSFIDDRAVEASYGGGTDLAPVLAEMGACAPDPDAVTSTTARARPPALDDEADRFSAIDGEMEDVASEFLRRVGEEVALAEVNQTAVEQPSDLPTIPPPSARIDAWAREADEQTPRGQQQHLGKSGLSHGLSGVRV